jgi:hypothetical protein
VLDPVQGLVLDPVHRRVQLGYRILGPELVVGRMDGAVDKRAVDKRAADTRAADTRDVAEDTKVAGKTVVDTRDVAEDTKVAGMTVVDTMVVDKKAAGTKAADMDTHFRRLDSYKN